MSNTNNKDYDIGEEIRAWGVCIPDQAADEVVKTLKSRWINTGKKEKEFREKICDRFQAPFATACTSGTAALKIALKSLGVKPGDEVISTPYTFMATNTSILELGGIPIFADIQYDTLNLDPDSVAERITEKTKAIICVHYAGNPVDLDELRSVAKKHDLPIIEDSAHAMASEYKGKPIGATGDIACFSFQCVKIVTCGDGGVVTTTNKKLHEKIQKTSWYGINRDAKKVDYLDPLPHHPTELGLKANMNDIVASLACAAMNHLDTALEFRQTIGSQYRHELGGLDNIELMNYKDDRKPNYQIFPVHVKNRDKFAKYMWENGVQVNINNRRNDIYPVFGGLRKDLPNLEKADQDVILIPLHSDLTESNVEKIISCIKKYDKL
tara:strand:+ start:17211 stop:18356 length:1146 start_codon:yes stop_codon:yes gene_type:complete